MGKTLNNKKMKKLIFSLAFVLFVHFTFSIENCFAQWQTVESVSPDQNTINIPLNSDIKSYFNQSMNGSTIDGNSVTFFGSMTGKKQGVITYNSGNNSMQIVPNNPFKIGELISTTLNSEIKTSSDNPIVPFVWSFTTISNPANACFNVVDIVNTGTGTGPSSLITGDFDGDGDLDLATILNSIGSISILKNNGSGAFTQTSTVSVGTAPYGITAGDFDGDGDLDLAVSHYSSNDVYILKNNGTGSFTVTSTIYVAAYLFGITSADFDGDGDIDLAVTSFYTGLFILKNNSTGTFTVTGGGLVTIPMDITAADFDGDGDVDIAVGTKYSNTLYICKNDGSGVFSVSSTISIPNKGITSADLDGDGDMDIALTGHPWAVNFVTILKNDGSGTFAISSVVSGALNSLVIIPADFDGDGDMDLAASFYNGAATVSILKNNGTGTVTSSLVSTGSYPFGLAAGDFNGDGVLDLGVANNSSNTISILSNLSLPVVNLGEDITTCVGETVILDAGNPGATYLWSNSATTQTIDVTTSGIYSVLVTNEGGSASDDIEVTFNALPEANAGDDANIYIGYPPYSTQLNATGGVTYSWSPTEGLSNPNIADPIAQPVESTLYTVTVTDANGCSATDEVFVNVVDVRCGKKNDKVIVCHIPPGNPGNAHTICVSYNAVAAHLAHGDYLGNCGDQLVTLPTEYELHANYPNPFNPMTRIDYSLPFDSKVNIQIFDVVGREIATLVNDNQKAGYYTIDFNASNISSGIYFYRMIAGDFVAIKKMLLIK